MKKLNLLIIVSIVVGLYSCKTVEIADFSPVGRNVKLLKNLEPQVDMFSFQSAYSLGTTSTAGFGSAYGAPTGTGIMSIGAFGSESTSKIDQRIQDVLTLFNRDVNDNICDPYTEKSGYIICKIPASVAKSKGMILFLPSALTLYTINLFGFPLQFYQTELEVEVEIKNIKNETIVRYKGYGKSKLPIALYWGYSAMQKPDGQIFRKTNIESFKMAMKEIKQQIERDAVILNEKLN